MDVDITLMSKLFSNPVTLVDTSKNVHKFAGQSFLFSIVLTMETDRASLSNRGCSSTTRVSMLYGDEELAGIYKSTQLPPEYQALAYLTNLKADGGIPALKTDFRNCVGSVDFFYIPLSLKYVPNPRSSGHANGIIVSKSKGTYFLIEPQYSKEQPSRSDTPKIYTAIESIMTEIGATDFKRIELNTTCPQSLTADENCLFWTVFLTREIIRNMYKTEDPNTTIAEVTKRGKDQLNKEIEAFKQQVWKAAMDSLAKSNMRWVEYERAKTPRTGGMYWPLKYYRGLTRKQNAQRKRSATRRTKMSFKDPKAYVPFKSDKGVKTRKSSYTERFHKKYPDAKSLSEIAKATGISKSILQEVYDRGMAAWRTGHRPGASQHAWGMARVHSFVMKGKTWRTADADLARKV